MNEKLMKRLGLKPDATADQIEAAIGLALDRADALAAENDKLKQAPAQTDAAKLEQRIVRKIAESGGALNREQALVAIQHQDEAKAKGKAKK